MFLGEHRKRTTSTDVWWLNNKKKLYSLWIPDPKTLKYSENIPRYFWIEGFLCERKNTTTWLIRSVDQFYYGSFAALFVQKYTKIRIFIDQISNAFQILSFSLIKACWKRAWKKALTRLAKLASPIVVRS